MITAQTVTFLRGVWASDITPILEANLHQVHLALVQAETIDQVRMLQGKAKAYLAMLKLPEALAAQLDRDEDTNGHG